MVFMVGGPELGPALDRDLLELKRAGSSEDVNVIVAIQRTARSFTQWLEILPVDQDGNPAETKEVGHSKKGTLIERLDKFLNHVKQHCPAEKYALIFWAHASGLSLGRLEPGAREDVIHLRKLGRSIGRFREGRRRSKKLDILGFCACAVSKAEFAIELSDDVSYLVSSQVGISTLMTWPFDTILRRLLLSPTVDPERLASYIVQLFEESYEPPPVALTAVNLDRSGNLQKVVDGLARTILAALNDTADGELNMLCVLRAFRRALEAYPYDLESLVDFIDFCVKLVEEGDLDTKTRTMARAILDMKHKSIIVQNARSGPKFSSLNGLSIIAPDFDDPEWLESVDSQTAGSHRLWEMTGWLTMSRRVYEYAALHPEFLNV
jgi:hypothetical protein